MSNCENCVHFHPGEIQTFELGYCDAKSGGVDIDGRMYYGLNVLLSCQLYKLGFLRKDFALQRDVERPILAPEEHSFIMCPACGAIEPLLPQGEQEIHIHMCPSKKVKCFATITRKQKQQIQIMPREF